MEHLESIQNNSLLITYDNKVIPSNFKEMANIVNIISSSPGCSKSLIERIKGKIQESLLISFLF